MEKKSLLTKIEWLIKKVVNRETIVYVIAGAMTTVVNFCSYEGLYRLGIPNLTANALAWAVAVTFAYIVNKKNVFRSHSDDAKDEATMLTKFFGARVITLLIEQSGLFLFTEYMSFSRLPVKAGLAIIVVVLNYLFSKLYIFNKKVQNNTLD